MPGLRLLGSTSTLTTVPIIISACLASALSNVVAVLPSSRLIRKSVQGPPGVHAFRSATVSMVLNQISPDGGGCSATRSFRVASCLSLAANLRR